MWTAKTLIRLGGCPGWSESSLGAQSLCWLCHVAAHFPFELIHTLKFPCYVYKLTSGIGQVMHQLFVTTLHRGYWLFSLQSRVFAQHCGDIFYGILTDKFEIAPARLGMKLKKLGSTALRGWWRWGQNMALKPHYVSAVPGPILRGRSYKWLTGALLKSCLFQFAAINEY